MDIFISYSSKDETIAFDICSYLENNDLACWIAPRNVPGGQNYAAEIVSSIRACKAFVLILTKNANDANHVISEVNQAFNNKKIIIAFKIGDFNLCDTLDFYLGTSHRINTNSRYTEFYKELLIDCQKALGIEIEVQEKKTTKAIIQIIDKQTLLCNVNGIEQNIPNMLVELKNFLGSYSTHFFLFDNIVYNIDELTEGSFGLLTGITSFNQFLTKNLIEAIRTECLPAQRFYELVRDRKDWETEIRISDKAKEILAYSFVGVIGKELGKLMAIGKEDCSEIKQRKYVEKCITITKRCLDLIIYALLSELWDRSQVNKLIYTEQERNALSQKFDSPFELQIKEQISLLYLLIAIFNNPENKLEFPIPELISFAVSSENRTELILVCENIQKLQGNKYDIKDCFEVERNLVLFFKHFCFLTKYQMASVKKIGYRQIKNYSPGFVHRYIAVGIDNKANIDAEKVEYHEDTTYSDSVLLFYKGENFKKSINLFPFIIDYNSITFEQGSKICILNSVPIEDNYLEYVFLDDNSFIRLEKNDMQGQEKNLNESLLNEEKMKILNIKCVVDRFKEARRSILGELCFDDL